ncbi:MAG: transketolase [Candidatus Omnitrophica bacterium]|nr:transketolase [Candidatus Omnitrophota bacterium]MDD5775495.1 transketolase [Candidatus Omnitrophota bacterium]
MNINTGKITRLQRLSARIRSDVLEMTVKAGAGHIAPSFSCIDILVTLYYGGVMRVRPRDPLWKGRDRFILSKGQAAVALYAVLAGMGFLKRPELMTFTQKGSRLGGHTENTIPGVEAFTGSLGHGLSIGAGLALAAKIDGNDFKTIVLLGDGECHEGSVWEAAMFAGQHRLGNLIAVIDSNGLSATDYLDRYLSVRPLEEKWRAFGWDVRTVDGHSHRDILSVMAGISGTGRPTAIIAQTTKGKGVSFMENKPIWHYRIPVGRELAAARKELHAQAGLRRSS